MSLLNLEFIGIFKLVATFYRYVMHCSVLCCVVLCSWCFVWPMLSVSLVSPFIGVHSVFSNAYLSTFNWKPLNNIFKANNSLGILLTLFNMMSYFLVLCCQLICSPWLSSFIIITETVIIEMFRSYYRFCHFVVWLTAINII